MQITKLEAGKKNPQKINVYIDDKFAFNIDALEIANAKLLVGKELTKDNVRNFKSISSTAKLYEYCLKLISRRPRSESEVRFKIYYISKKWSKEYSEETIESIIDKLKKHSYLNDEIFAQWWIENRTQFRPKGKYALKQELKQKGVSNEIIDQALDDFYPSENEEDMIYKLASKKYKLLEKEEENKRRQKTLAYLLRKGFDYDKIVIVLGKLNDKES